MSEEIHKLLTKWLLALMDFPSSTPIHNVNGGRTGEVYMICSKFLFPFLFRTEVNENSTSM